MITAILTSSREDSDPEQMSSAPAKPSFPGHVTRSLEDNKETQRSLLFSHEIEIIKALYPFVSNRQLLALSVN